MSFKPISSNELITYSFEAAKDMFVAEFGDPDKPEHEQDLFIICDELLDAKWDAYHHKGSWHKEHMKGSVMREMTESDAQEFFRQYLKPRVKEAEAPEGDEPKEEEGEGKKKRAKKAA